MSKESPSTKPLREWNSSLAQFLKDFRSGTRKLRREAVQHWECDPSGTPLDNFHAYLCGTYGSSVSKLYAACRHIQRSIPQRDHLAYTVFARLILEQTAMLRHLLFKTGSAVSVPDGELPSQEALQGVLDAFQRSVAGSRFGWAGLWELGFTGLVANAEKHPPNIRQTNVLTWIQSWGEREPRITVLYDLLCDTVHPSMGGNMLFMQNHPSKIRFSASPPSPFGDFIVWNTLEQVAYVQKHAIEILAAFRRSIDLGKPSE